ncbi:MAG TPA: hypothetical protein V6D21_22570 [Candidatus Obscuribacterales bacterium]
MFNPLSKIKDIIKDIVEIEKIVEVTGEKAKDIIQTSNIFAKNPNESEESYQARLKYLQNKENQKTERLKIKLENKQQMALLKDEHKRVKGEQKTEQKEERALARQQKKEE